MTDKAEMLRSLNHELELMDDPRLAELSKNLVPGEGNVNSRIVFIGEAPGRDEDQARRPFVGAAGKILNDSLERIELSRNDVYITNVVKRRPPNNRPPRKSETAVFLPYLWRELEIVNPTAICLLGSTATKALLDRPLAEARNKFIRKGKWAFFSTYHPAALLYDPSLKETLVKDLKTLRKFTLKHAEPNSENEE